MTEKLFHADPYLREFSAHVVRSTTAGKQPAVVLDRTAFYATSGGQPNDTGQINSIAVLDVVEDETSNDIVHVLAAPLPDGVVQGSEAQGIIDWPRRFDHMQQHTGQHILSQAFEQMLDAATVSFHLGADVCTIDVQLASLSAAQAGAVEDMANGAVFSDAPVTTHVVTRAELSRFPLRKQPLVSGMIRIVEIAGFDFSPCGGTHVRAAGEVGMVKIRRWEKRGNTLRVDFHCGKRALLDYRWKNDAVNALANGLSVKDADVQAAVERSLAQARDSFKALEEARQKLIEYESRLLLAETPPANGVRLIVRLLDDRSSEEARRLALTLAAAPGTIALLGVRSADRASLIFARSADLSHDMNALLKGVAPTIQGRGGGTPSLAQGGGPGVDRLDEALQAAGRIAGAQ
jgi:alanyl-tRNA synthetase